MLLFYKKRQNNIFSLNDYQNLSICIYMLFTISKNIFVSIYLERIQMKKYIFLILSLLLILGLCAESVSAGSGMVISSTVDKSTVNVGDPVTFTVTLSNTGSTNYSNVNLVVPLPAGLQYVSHTGQGTYNSGNGTWNVGNLKSGVTKQLTITVQAQDTLQDQLVELVASLLNNDQNETAADSKVVLTVLNSTGNGSSNDTGNGSVENNTTVNPIVLKNVVNVSSAQPGDLVNFTINIKNNGTVDYSNLMLQIALPDGLEYVSHTANVTNKNYTGGIWYLGNLKSGVSKQFNLTARVLVNVVGQNKTLNISLVPNSQNATAKNVTSGVLVLNSTNHIFNTNTTTTLLDSVDTLWKNNTLANGTYSSMVLDSAGKPHIVYFQFPVLKYTYLTENGWVTETIETNNSIEGTGFYPSLALDASNNPHVVYSSGNTLLKYAYKDQSGWHTETVASGDFSYTQILIYNNSPQLSFYSNKEEAVKYAYKNGTNWLVESVAKAGGHWNSMALDSAGNPVITYHNDNEGGDLRCAFRAAINNWTSVIVDNSAHVGSWNSIVLGSDGNPQISYIMQNGGVKYAYWDGLNWISEMIDNCNAQGSKITLDKENNPRITYWDIINNQLKFAYKDQNSSQWMVENVNVDGASPWSSLVLDQAGVPSIAYSNGNGYLNYVHLAPVLAKINSTHDTGFYNAPFNVILASDKNATIYYTTDGSDPRNSTARILYRGPLTINSEGTTVLKFAAVGNYSYWSDVWSEVYTKNYTMDTVAPTVNANLASGKYNTYKNVILVSNEASTIYYTTDGSDPRYSSTRLKYSTAINLTRDGTTNLKFAALDNAGTWSAVNSRTYSLSFPSTALTVSNKGSGKICVVYYIDVTLPDGTKQYKKVSATLYSGRSLVVNIGKYPVGTKFTYTQYIYNKASYKKTINVYNKFSSSNGASFTQRVYMTGVISGHYVYSIEQATLTSSGIKGTIIRAPLRK
jgi:uncharacterized repeat protein (TIGR01451 family)